MTSSRMEVKKGPVRDIFIIYIIFFFDLYRRIPFILYRVSFLNQLIELSLSPTSLILTGSSLFDVLFKITSILCFSKLKIKNLIKR